MVPWGIWLHINNAIFKGFKKNVGEVIKKIHKTLLEYKEYKVKEKEQMMVNPLYFGTHLLGSLTEESTTKRVELGL